MEEKTNQEFCFSIIIPVRPNDSRATSDLIKNMYYPQGKIEILFIEGYQPSIQRNKGAECATGDILCFIDNDCRLTPDFFNEIVKGFYWNSNEETAVVGGPSLMMTDNSLIKKLFSIALSSYFAHYHMRARYKPIGKIRESNEKELIGCNISIKRAVFEKLGGFNEKLYPNEENEFLNKLQLNGYNIIYNPNLVVYRKMKDSFLKFAKRFFKYGKGRAKEICSEPLNLNFIYLLPGFFLLYLVGLIFIHNFYYFLPVGIYIIGAFISSLLTVLKERRIGLFFLLPLIYFIMHTSYAIGMVSGFIKKIFETKKLRKVEVNVEKIKWFGKNWG